MSHPTKSEQRDEALAAAALVFAVTAPATYMLERLYEYARGQGGDPTMVLRTLDTVYYWRVGVAVWWGVTVACVAFALFRRAPGGAEGRARGIAVAAALVVPVMAFTAWFFP